MRGRRAFLNWLGGGALVAVAPQASGAERGPAYPEIKAPVRLVFPRDHGAHLDHRVEWWYITAWLDGGGARVLGVQMTFFRLRPRTNESSWTPLAPRQLVFAHAAISDPTEGKLIHDQRAARVGPGGAQLLANDTDVSLDGWRLLRSTRDGNERYQAVINASRFKFDLNFEPTQPILLQGDAGFSRKGPQPSQASCYYSRPHLAVTGTVQRSGESAARPVQGRAWLDHEWASELMAADAEGWDWIGIHLADGGSIMAFRMRSTAQRDLWTAATIRSGKGDVKTFSEGSVKIQPLQRWRSDRTQVRYPVAMRITLGDNSWDIEPLFEDQELDARASVGTLYWEGAVRAKQGGREVGRGYLELTGYWRPLVI